MGLLRNLSTGEVVEQALWAARELRALAAEGQHNTPLPAGLTNLVFMGMGEPFANYDRWWGAVERLHDPQGFNFGARRMTVSTVGLVPGIRRLAAEDLPINLAISLHAADDTLRSEMMPVNRRYPLADLLDATRAYTEQTRRRVSFEYVLLQGVNDDPAQARQLARLLRGDGQAAPLLCHVNLIPWNPVPGAPLGRSERRRVLDFQRVLHDAGVACTVRVERGVDIDAACGQLAGYVEQQQGSRAQQQVIELT
jgi:23S rRNA (adenine2503-C2)-methyltransferase